MTFLSTKEQVELIASRLETATYILTLLAAVTGVSFLLVNRRLQHFLKIESDDMQQRLAETGALSEAAKADAATARVQTEDLKTERTKLELRLKEMEQSNSKLAATNTEHEHKIESLQEARKPRTVSAPQAAQLSSLLKPFSGQRVKVEIFARDNETGTFAQQVLSALQSAGLHPDVFNMMDISGTGIMILVHDFNSVPPLASTLQHAFKAAGLNIDGLARPDLVPNPGEFVLGIGEKPPTP